MKKEVRMFESLHVGSALKKLSLFIEHVIIRGSICETFRSTGLASGARILYQFAQISLCPGYHAALFLFETSISIQY